MDVPAFREWARFKLGKSRTLFEDAMIAAEAEVHGLPVATRDRSDSVNRTLVRLRRDDAAGPR